MGTVTATDVSLFSLSQALSINTSAQLSPVSSPTVAALSNVEIHDIVEISAQALALQAKGVGHYSAEVPALALQLRAEIEGFDIVAISARALQAAAKSTGAIDTSPSAANSSPRGTPA